MVSYTEADVRQWWAIGQARCISRVPLTHPLYCQFCGRLIFFHTNGNGDCVFFDELGAPWPKHWCLQSEENIRQAANSDDLMRLVGLTIPPSHISPPTEAKIRKFEQSGVGEVITGVVLSTKLVKLGRSRSDTIARQPVAVWKNLLLLNPSQTLKLYTDRRCSLRIGQMIKVTLSKDTLGESDVFFAESFQAEEAPQEEKSR